MTAALLNEHVVRLCIKFVQHEVTPTGAEGAEVVQSE